MLRTSADEDVRLSQPAQNEDKRQREKDKRNSRLIPSL
jgi:hypothetical protein